VTGLFIAASDDLTTYKPVLVIWTVASALADLIITLCMMIILRHARASSFFGETRNIISRLLRLTIQTGLLTTTLAIPIPPLVFANEIGIWSLTAFLIGKSYVISLLANLNERSYRTTLDVALEINGFTDCSQLPPMIFNPNPNPDKGAKLGGEISSLKSLIRSVAHSLRYDPTSAPEQALQAGYKAHSEKGGSLKSTGGSSNSSVEVFEAISRGV